MLNACDEGLHDCDEKYGICINAGNSSYTCGCVYGSLQDKNIPVEGTACKIGIFAS